MARKGMISGPLAGMPDAFHAAESAMSLTPAGRGSYGINHKNMAPMAGKPQTPAQHEAVKKAAAASVASRRAGTVTKIPGV